MNKLLLFLLLPIISFSQGVGCQDSIACDYDVNAIASSISFNTPVVTGSTMNIGLVTDLDNNLIINDEIGAFVFFDDYYYCVGLVEFEGENTALNIYGDDPLTTIQDGCLSNEIIYFFVKREISTDQYTVFETDVSLVNAEDYNLSLTNTYVENSLAIFLPFIVTNYQFDCTYPDEIYLDCDGNCINDDDGDGICDELEVVGCTDISACNYNELATEDDATCFNQLDVDIIDVNPSCNENNGMIDITPLNGVPPFSYDWSNGVNNQDLENLDSGVYSVLISDASLTTCSTFIVVELSNDDDGDGVCNENEVFGCTDPNAFSGYDPLATEEDGSCVYCASYDFSNNNGLHLNGMEFENATGVTISFWIYDDDWSLSDGNEEEFGYLIDLGHEDNYRYVIRWRDGVKGIQAYYEGTGFQAYQGVDCDGIGDDNCYNYNQTNVTYIIPPYDYINNPDVYNWWEDDGCNWKNITAVFCSNAVTLYIDGHMVQKSTTNVYYPEPIFSLIDNNVSESWNLAGAMNGNTQSWNGQMDEIRIWSRALSELEIQERLGDAIDINLDVVNEQLSNSGKLEGYWKFDSLSLYNQVTGISAYSNSDNLFSDQYCNYSCNNYDYSTACFDNSNSDCDACTPSEGCMDPEADNFDITAEIDNGGCIYYGCMDNGNHLWSYIPGLEACNYDSNANVNQYSMTDFQNPCVYPIDIFGVGYVDCDGNCLYDCDGDGACDWNQTHCYDTEGNLLSNLDQINNSTFEPFPDGLLDCLSFTYVDSVDNCIFNSGVDMLNNLTLDTIPDGVPDCLNEFDYSMYYNPLQTDVDGDGLGNACDNDDGGQIGCMDIDACNYDFWADNPCDDCCVYCFLNDCETYPSTYFVSESIGYVNGPYDCFGYCSDLNNDGLTDDVDGDSVCDLIDNCISVWNPGQIDSDANGIGDACEDVFINMYSQIQYSIYPNPFSDYTLIDFGNTQSMSKLIKIFEISGRLVYEKSTTADVEKIYKSDLNSGLYILEIYYNSIVLRDVLIIN